MVLDAQDVSSLVLPSSSSHKDVASPPLLDKICEKSEDRDRPLFLSAETLAFPAWLNGMKPRDCQQVT